MRKRHRNRQKKPLTDQMKLAAQLMFDGEKTGRIAASVGVHRTTIWRWYQRRDFQREINRIHDQFVRETRRRIRQAIRESPEHKKELAARRRLPGLAKKLSDAGNRGDMKAYRKAANAYDKCFNEAYSSSFKAVDRLFNSQNIQKPQKYRQPKRYIIEIVD